MPSHIRKEESSRLLAQENAILHKEDPKRARIDCKETFCLELGQRPKADGHQSGAS